MGPTPNGKSLKLFRFFWELSLMTFLLFWRFSLSESQKPRQRVSNADRKVFANPESFCDKFLIG